MMKRINEQRLIEAIPDALRRWLRENPENRHLVEAAPMIKGESGSSLPRRRPQGETVQLMLF